MRIDLRDQDSADAGDRLALIVECGGERFDIPANQRARAGSGDPDHAEHSVERSMSGSEAA